MSKKKLLESQVSSIDRMRRLAGITITGDSNWAGTPSMAVRRQVNHGLVESAFLKPAFEGPEREAYIKQLVERVKAALKRHIRLRRDGYFGGAVSERDSPGYDLYLHIDETELDEDSDYGDGEDIPVLVHYVIEGDEEAFDDAVDGLEEDVVSALKKDVPEIKLAGRDRIGKYEDCVFRFVVRA